MLKIKLSLQATYKASFLLVVAILIILAFLEYQYVMKPCLLSYVERTLLFALALVFWMGYLYDHSPLSIKVFSWIGFIINILGIATVMRHLWIQRTAGNFISSYINKSDSFILTLKEAFLSGIAPGCSQIYRIFWEIRITELILASFIFFAIICFIQQFRKL